MPKVVRADDITTAINSKTRSGVLYLIWLYYMILYLAILISIYYITNTPKPLPLPTRTNPQPGNNAPGATHLCRKWQKIKAYLRHKLVASQSWGPRHRAYKPEYILTIWTFICYRCLYTFYCLFHPWICFTRCIFEHILTDIYVTGRQYNTFHILDLLTLSIKGS